MLDTRKNFITVWNKLNTRYNELVNIFTLTKAEYDEFKLVNLKINELLRDDAFYFGFENLKAGTII